MVNIPIKIPSNINIVRKGFKTVIIMFEGFLEITIFKTLKDTDIRITNKLNAYIEKLGLNCQSDINYICTLQGYCAYQKYLLENNATLCKKNEKCKYLKEEIIKNKKVKKDV